MCCCAQLQTTGMTYFRKRSPPLKDEEESAARLLTEHPGCVVCHPSSVMSPLTRKWGWPDYRGRPESQEVAFWDLGSIRGKDWKPPCRGAGRRSGRSRSLARCCTRSGWPSKQAWRGLKTSTQTGNRIRFRPLWQKLTFSPWGCFLKFQLNQTEETSGAPEITM